MLISTIHMQESDIQKTVLNILTNRWIDPKGKLFRKLIREGYKYVDRLSDYLEDIGTICVGEFELDPLIEFSHPALILPLSILASRSDICKKFPINVESAVAGGMSLFALEKNKRSGGLRETLSSLQNLMEMNYCNLFILLGMTWDREETKAWRNNVLMKFLYHPNLVLSRYKPNALYDAFTKADILEPEHVLALTRLLG